MEFFKIFGFDNPRLNLDSQDLERRYYQLSMKYHPDRNRSGACSLDLSARLNQAYQTLKDPWQRALYYLDQNSRKMDSKVPPGLAEVYFEVQESNDIDSSQRMYELVRALRSDLDQKLLQAFSQIDSRQDRVDSDFSSHDDSSLNELKELVTEHTYLKSMLRDLEIKLSAGSKNES